MVLQGRKCSIRCYCSGSEIVKLKIYCKGLIMKKQYEQPKAEKVEFDYQETVTASTDANTYNNDPNGQYHKCTCTTYYAPGWDQNC